MVLRTNINQNNRSMFRQQLPLLLEKSGPMNAVVGDVAGQAMAGLVLGLTK